MPECHRPRTRRSGPQFVIPAKAGIHALTFRERTSTAIPRPTSTRRRRHSAHARRMPMQAQFARRPKRALAEPTQAPLFVFPAIESLARSPDTGRESRGRRGGTNASRTIPSTNDPIFITWCAGASRHERLVRTCTPQSTSMAAFQGRNVANCRPMVNGGMRKCSAGACPPLGSGWGVAESAAPIRCTKPQLVIFHTSVCRHQPAPAGTSDCYESMSRTPIRDRPLRQPLIGHSRHPFVIPGPRFVNAMKITSRLVVPAPNSSFPRRRESTH